MDKKETAIGKAGERKEFQAEGTTRCEDPKRRKDWFLRGTAGTGVGKEGFKVKQVMLPAPSRFRFCSEAIGRF